MSAQEVIARMVGDTFGSSEEFAKDLLAVLEGSGYVVIQIATDVVECVE